MILDTVYAKISVNSNGLLPKVKTKRLVIMTKSNKVNMLVKHHGLTYKKALAYIKENPMENLAMIIN